MNKKSICVVAALAVSLTACSSKPRYFEPRLAAAPDNQERFEAAQENCRTMVAEGQRSGFGARLASGGLGVAAGVGVTAATMGGTYGTMAAAATAASAALVMMPVIGVAAAWGVAKANKAKKEKDVKEATALCLSELGYTVSEWKVAKRPKKKAKPA